MAQLQEVLVRLQEHQSELGALGVGSLSVFGSVARGEGRSGSDVDLLVEFARPVDLFEFVHVKNYLESILGCPVDLATPDALRPEMKERILKEAVSLPALRPALERMLAET